MTASLAHPGTTIRSNAIFDGQIRNRHVPIDVENSAIVVPADSQDASARSLDDQILINEKLPARQNDCWPRNSEVNRVTRAGGCNG